MTQNSEKNFQLKIMAQYNYAVALFHLSQDWAYERAAKTFQSLLEELEKYPQNEHADIRCLIRSSLAATYAKLASRSTTNKSTLIDLAILEADRVLQEANATSTSLSNAQTAIGYAHLANDDVSEAIKVFRRTLEEYPDNVPLMLGLGEAYRRNNQTEEALSMYKHATMISPLNGYAVYRLGNIFRQMGRIYEAIETLKRAPEYAHARLVLGKIYQTEGSLQEALEEFRYATTLNSRMGEAWVNIAWTIHEMQDENLFKEAEIAARRAVQLEKNKAQFWHRSSVLAICLVDAGRYELALKEAHKSVELSEKPKAQAYFVLALAQYKVGQLSQSLETIEKAVELDKKGDWKTEALKLRQQVKELIASSSEKA